MSAQQESPWDGEGVQAAKACQRAAQDLEAPNDVHAEAGLAGWSCFLLALEGDGWEVRRRGEPTDGGLRIFDREGKPIVEGSRIKLKGNDNPGTVIQLGTSGFEKGWVRVEFDGGDGWVEYGTKTISHLCDWLTVTP